MVYLLNLPASMPSPGHPGRTDRCKGTGAPRREWLPEERRAEGNQVPAEMPSVGARAGRGPQAFVSPVLWEPRVRREE